jgi:hypothetical protein
MDNAVYYKAAYAAAALVYVAYAVSLWWRDRQLARRAAALRGPDGGAAPRAG